MATRVARSNGAVQVTDPISTTEPTSIDIRNMFTVPHIAEAHSYSAGLKSTHISSEVEAHASDLRISSVGRKGVEPLTPCASCKCSAN